MKKYLLILLIITVNLALLPALCRAEGFTSDGNPGDAASGDAVSAPASFETWNYRDLNQNYKPQLSPTTDVSAIVQPEYGFTLKQPSGLQVTPGDITNNYWRTTNEGDAVLPITLKLVYTQLNLGEVGPPWTVEAWVNGTFRATLDAGTNFYVSGESVADDSSMPFYYRVYTPSGATNNTAVFMTSEVSTTKTPTGQYQGGNTYYYGGYGLNSNTSVNYVATPVVTITRTSTVDSPTTYTAMASTHEAVPGAVITFTITYSNEGYGAATSVEVVDKVPANTNLAHFNQTGSSGYVYVTAPHGSSSNWRVYYSTAESPSKVYGNYTDWTLISTLANSTDAFPFSITGNYTYRSNDAQFAAKWVKWEKVDSIPGIQDQNHIRTLTWGVTIR